jgi:transcription termination/antitermination protein NusG
LGLLISLLVKQLSLYLGFDIGAMKKRWYVVHTYSGFENKVKASLEERTRIANMSDLFEEVLVPSEQIVEMLKGKKKTTSRKFFPGYILVKMGFCEESWHLVKSTPKVTGFVGGTSTPTPVPDAEIEALKRQMEEGAIKPKPKISFERGENVRIVDGPFTNFNGLVDEVKSDKGKLRVLVSIFGRSTPVELYFIQVEKA